MPLRKATSDDITTMLKLGRAMHDESPRFRTLAFAPENLEQTLRTVINSDAGFAYLYEMDGRAVGVMVGMCYPHWAGRDLVACDMALFVDPEHRGGMAAPRLLNAYRQWAELMGVPPGFTWFGITTGVNEEQTQHLCERLGWHRVGVVMGV